MIIDSLTPLHKTKSHFRHSVFSNNKFMKLWSAQVLSQVTVNILNFVLAVSVYNMTKSNSAVSYIVISFGLAAFLFGAPAGVIVDYLDNKKTLILSILFRALFVLSLLFISHSIVLTILLAFILNSITQFFFPAEASSIPLIVKNENLLQANALYSMTYFAAQIIGYVSAGIILNVLSFNFTIFLMSACFLIAVFLIYKIDFPIEEKAKITWEKVKKEIVNDFSKGLTYIYKNAKIKEPLAYLAMSQVLSAAFLTLIPGYAVEVLGLKVEDTSLYLIAPAAFGMLLGGLYLNIFGRKINRRKLIDIGAKGAFLSFALLALLQRVPFSSLSNQLEFSDTISNAYNRFLGVDLLIFGVFFMILAGISNAFIIIVNNTRLQMRTNSDLRGRVYGVLQTIVTVSAFVPVIMAGRLADVIGINLVIFAVAVLILSIHLVIRYKYSRSLG